MDWELKCVHNICVYENHIVVIDKMEQEGSDYGIEHMRGLTVHMSPVEMIKLIYILIKATESIITRKVDWEIFDDRKAILKEIAKQFAEVDKQFSSIINNINRIY